MSNRPKPPDELDGEALLEWHRVCDELDDAGRLDKIDRSALVLYAFTWAGWWQAEQEVVKKGFTRTISNGEETTSVAFNVAATKAKLLARLLNDMGLTHRTRPRTKVPEADELPID